MALRDWEERDREKMKQSHSYLLSIPSIDHYNVNCSESS